MKILVLQLRRVGDILLTTPVLPFLRQVHPDAIIDFLAEPMGKSILETNPHINNVLLYDKNHPMKEIFRIRKRKYDVVLDFMNNPRTSLLTCLSGSKVRVGFHTGPRSIFYNIRVPVPREPEYVPLRKIRMVKYWLGLQNNKLWEPKSYRPELFLTDEDERMALDWMRKEKVHPKSFLILVPAHRHPIRQWRWEGFQSVGIELSKRGNKVFLAWGPGEEEMMKAIRSHHEEELGLLPPTTLRQMAAIFKYSRLVVTNDSGAMHLAVAVNTPTVTLYGPTRPIDWNPALTGFPSKTQDVALTAPEVDCLGCHRSECPVGHICMKNLKEERVLDACELIFKEN